MMDVRSDMQRPDHERTHPRNNYSDAGFQKDDGKTIELVQACREEKKTEQSDGNGYSWEKEDRTNENKMERRVPTRLEKSTGLRAGEEMDRAMWRRKIISHTGDTT